MIKEIKKLFNDQILAKAAQLFNTTAPQLKYIGGFESFVYEFVTNNKFHILKITHTIRRTVNNLIGEVEFVNHLALNGVSVSKAVKSINNRFVEEVLSTKGFFLVYAFEKAPGSMIGNNEWDIEKLYKWGQLTATINLHSQSFYPSSEVFKRNNWLDETQYYFDLFIPKSEKEVRKKTYALLAKIDKLPKNRKNFGLAHNDLHYGNFFYYYGKLTAFDFDDCTFHYYVNDIAIALYHLIEIKRPELSVTKYIDFFKEHYIGGYNSILPITDFWLRTIPDFLKLRNTLIYATFYQRYDIKKLTEKQLQIMEKHKKMILDDKWVNENA